MDGYAVVASASAPLVLRTAMVSAKYQPPATAARMAEYAATGDAFVLMVHGSAMTDA
jgi:hypothetical protein